MNNLNSIVTQKPAYIQASNIENLKKSFKTTFTDLHGENVVNRLLTATPTDNKVRELMNIYHDDPLLRWKNIEFWLKREKWRYVYAHNYISMIILGLQHYSDELYAGWW